MAALLRANKESGCKMILPLLLIAGIGAFGIHDSNTTKENQKTHAVANADYHARKAVLTQHNGLYCEKVRYNQELCWKVERVK